MAVYICFEIFFLLRGRKERRVSAFFPCPMVHKLHLSNIDILIISYPNTEKYWRKQKKKKKHYPMKLSISTTSWFYDITFLMEKGWPCYFSPPIKHIIFYGNNCYCNDQRLCLLKNVLKQPSKNLQADESKASVKVKNMQCWDWERFTCFHFSLWTFRQSLS